MIITKLRKLNAILKELGEKSVVAEIDHTLPITYGEVAKNYPKLGSRKIDVHYELSNPLELTYITYEEQVKVWGPKTRETEFATITFETQEEKTVKVDGKGAQIAINEEFVDAALKKVTERIREVTRINLIDELVTERLKEKGIV